jgi:hypothetical protein
LARATTKKKPPPATGKPPRAASRAVANQRRARGGPSLNAYRVKIRMYRQGLGDCFLIFLPRTVGGDRPYTILIDCGVILGTPDPGTIMTRVVDDILATTKGEIDLLIATHEHWDHLSGFIQAKDSFDKLTVHEVWLGWTEDATDPLTRKLKAEKDAALVALRLGLSRLQLAGDAEASAELGGILEFFGAAAGASTADALANVRKMTPKPRYCLPTDAPVQPEGVDATFYVLGPPHDESSLRKINPSARNKETYGLALESFQLYLDGAGTALDGSDRGRPFDQQYEIPFSYAGGMDFFRERYWKPEGSPDDWRRIDADWLGGSPELALQLDSLTNNTSLVLAIELPDGDVLVFAADAQVGNWLSWQDLKWKVGDRAVTGPDLLKRAIFYKVGHHGSHNATLSEKGLEQMERLRVAMIPVDQAMAAKKRWGHMPLDELVAALGKKAKGAVLRVDRPMPATQEQVVEDKLFFEATF